MRSFRFGLRRFCSRPVQKYPQYVDLVGKTPMLDLTKFARACGLPATSKTILLGKAEFFNPSFSMKDRPMKFIIEQAVADGKLKPGMTILAASSGNLGASAAMLGSIYGFDCTIITDQKCSQEKKDAITAYGAKLIVADPTQNYMEMELELATAQPEKYFSVDQYENLRNPFAHFHSTGADVFEQTSGTVTHFVAGASTGGTISGVGGYLKRENPCTKVILADPFGSVFTPMIETGEMITPGKFLVEGVGKQNIPGAMDISVIDSCIQISDAQTFQTCRDLARIEGLSVGGSSGMNVSAAVQVAKEAPDGSVVVTILCDLGIKYLSKVFNDDWIKEHKLDIEKYQIDADKENDTKNV